MNLTPCGPSSVPFQLLHQGKVRDVYELDAERLLMVASDRLSAFDVVLPDPIPDKGAILTQLSNFWFDHTASICPNHLTHQALPDVLDPAFFGRRAVITHRLRPLPIEAIARGYLLGSGYKEYQARGSVCGIKLKPGMELAAALPEPIFTPSSKAQVGAHDENISFDAVVQLIGSELAERVRAATLAIYRHAQSYALTRGIIIADTKLEFGLTADGALLVMDEMLTPDSSRFWEASSYRPGQSPESFDKQFVRDYLESINWDKTPPGPSLPAEVIAGTRAKYVAAYERLTGLSF